MWHNIYMKTLIFPRYIFTIFAGVVAFIPSVSFAANKTLSDLTSLLGSYMQQAIYLIMAFAVLTFVWGIYNYYLKPDADRGEAMNYVLYGTIGFFLMLSFWGLVNIIKNTLDLDNTAPSIPVIQSLQFRSGTPGVGSGGGASGVGSGGGTSGVGSGSSNYVAPLPNGSTINPVTGQGSGGGTPGQGSGGGTSGQGSGGVQGGVDYTPPATGPLDSGDQQINS